MAEREFGELLPLYLETVKKRLGTINSSLLELEKNIYSKSAIEDIFIAAHSLKSESSMMEFDQISRLAHAVEDVVSAIREGRLIVESALVSALFSALDKISAAVRSIGKGGPEPDLTSAADELAKFGGVKTVKRADIPSGGLTEPGTLVAPERISSIAVPVGRLDEMLNLVEELLITTRRLEHVLTDASPEARRTLKGLRRIISDLQYAVMQSRLIPLSFVFAPLPRLVRDLALAESKRAKVEILGGDTALDRTIIDHLTEPLVHLIRNAISHGLESEDARKKIGKSREGTIAITASRERDRVFVVLADDGRGIDTRALRKEAVQSGLMTEQQAKALSEQEAIELIWRGLSTAPEITTVAGRGIGMKAIRQAIESLGGRITVETKPGKFTKFALELPLTLAIIEVLLVRVAGQTYAIPGTAVTRSLSVSGNDIHAVANTDTIVVSDEDIPLLYLADLFGGTRTGKINEVVVIVHAAAEKIGLVVDEVASEDDVIVKPLSEVLRESRMFSGTTVLADGSPALVLDVAGVIQEGGLRVYK